MAAKIKWPRYGTILRYLQLCLWLKPHSILVYHSEQTVRNFNVTAYTVEFFVHCLKKVFTMACYNSDNNKPILTIFGGNVTEKVSSDQAVFSVFFCVCC